MGLRSQLYWQIQQWSGQRIESAEDIRKLPIPDELKNRVGTIEGLEKVIQFLSEQCSYR